MVTHVLVHHTSGDVNSLVIWDLDQYFTEALKSFLELIRFVEHQSQMEPAAHEVLLKL